MAMTVYDSTDSGAPVITNVNGSLNALLYACLVTGYGSKPGAGWTREYTGTNLAVYKQGTGGNGRYLRVFDGSLQTGDSSRRVNLRGYETMSAVSTGTGPFPTTGQISGNGANYMYFYVSTTVVTWTLYATSSYFMLIADAYYPNNFNTIMAFGTFFSFKSGDIYNDVLIASINNTDSAWGAQNNGVGYDSLTNTGVWVARNDIGTAGSKIAGIVSNMAVFASSLGAGSAYYPYPDRVTSGLFQSQPTLWCDGYRRGRLPGLWETYHTPASVGGYGTTWSGGPGPLNGKTFKLFSSIYPYNASVTIETSDTWN